jgi:hypothetical protein
MAIPFSNAALTKITSVGSGDDYDQPASTGTDRWTGSVGIYVAEEIVEVLGNERVDEVKQTRLEIPYAVGQLIVRGDTLTYTYEGAQVPRVAGTISRAQLIGRVRVLLEDA